MKDQNMDQRRFSESNDEIDHTESEEGIAQDRPNFDGNDALFRQREISGDFNSTQTPFKKGGKSEREQKFQGTNYGSSGFEIEDLESQIQPG